MNVQLSKTLNGFSNSTVSLQNETIMFSVLTEPPARMLIRHKVHTIHACMQISEWSNGPWLSASSLHW